MWLFTNVGLFSIVQKTGDAFLTIRARVAADLDELRKTYMPELSPTVSKGGTDYPVRATIGHEDFARGMAKLAREIHYSNFKSEIAKKQGQQRAAVYHEVWQTLLQLEKLPGKSKSAIIHSASTVSVPISELVQKVAAALSEITAKQPVVRPVAGAIVVRPDSRVIMVYSNYAGQGWHFPKGSVEDGENTVEAAIREAGEEAGILTTPVPDLKGIALKADGGFSESLGWSSPRLKKPKGKMSQGAADLLCLAASKVGLTAEEFEQQKYALFDALKEKIRLSWKTLPTYHIFAYSGDDKSLMDGESSKVEWFTVDEAKKQESLHRHTRTLLNDPNFAKWVKCASTCH